MEHLPKKIVGITSSQPKKWTMQTQWARKWGRAPSACWSSWNDTMYSEYHMEPQDLMFTLLSVSLTLLLSFLLIPPSLLLLWGYLLFVIANVVCYVFLIFGILKKGQSHTWQGWKIPIILMIHMKLILKCLQMRDCFESQKRCWTGEDNYDQEEY